MTITEFTKLVTDGEMDDIINESFEILKMRLRHLRDEKIVITRMTIAVGDKVKLSGLTPRYLNGTIVTIKAINPKRIVTDLNGRETTIPISCITKVDDDE